MFNYILLPIFCLLFIYLTLKNTKWGVYLVIMLLPTYLVRLTIFDVPTTLLEGMIILLFIIWLWKLKKEENLTFNPIVWIKNIKDSGLRIKYSRNPIPQALRLPMILFLISATISVFISPNLRSAMGIWKAYFLEPIFFLIVFVYTIKTSDDIKRVIRFLGITAIAIGIFAIIQKFTGVLIPNPFWAAEETRRVTTFFGYPNANALFLTPIIFLTLGNLINNFKISNYRLLFTSYNLLVIMLGTLTIIYTKSAGAVIALIIGLLCLLIFYKKTRLIALLLVLIVSAGLTFSPQAKTKLQNIYISTNEIYLPAQPSDLQMRTQQWRETMTMIKDVPFFGSGLAGYQTLIVPYHVNQHIEVYLYPHNFFLNFWTETGLLGLVSMIWILLVFFLMCYKSLLTHRLLTLTTASAMIALLVHGLVDVPYFKNDLAVLFWVIIGIIIILYNKRRGDRVVEGATLEK